MSTINTTKLSDANYTYMDRLAGMVKDHEPWPYKVIVFSGNKSLGTIYVRASSKKRAVFCGLKWWGVIHGSRLGKPNRAVAVKSTTPINLCSEQK